MAQRVYLHIGTPKSGTTFLQQSLWRYRRALAGRGLSVPGHRPDAQEFAALDLLGVDFGSYASPLVPGSWPRMVEQIRRGAAVVMLSYERLCRAGVETIGRAVEDLSFAEVHVLCTARDLGLQVPSMWQENIRNGDVQPFEQFVAAIQRRDDPAAVNFWGYHDYPAALARWARRVPRERIHLLPVRPGDPARLWSAISEITAVSLDGLVPSPASSNASLGWAQAEVLRAINAAVSGRIGRREYEMLIRGELNAVLSAQPDRSPIHLPTQQRGWLRRRAQHFIAAIDAAGYQVHGELSWLVPTDECVHSTTPAGQPAPVGTAGIVGATEVARAAVDALADLVTVLAERHYRPQPARKAKDALLDLAEQRAAVRNLLDAYVRAKAALHDPPASRPTD